MTKLLFCKIYDEKYDNDKSPKFKIGFRDTPNDVKNRITELWDKVKNEMIDDGIFQQTDTIILDAKSVAHIVGELERFSLLRTNKDIVGDSFEVFAEKQFVGEKGEFFTPREVVKMAIEIINPQPKERILDPACGSGGFLIYALEHIWEQMENNTNYSRSNLENLKKEFAQKYFYGIDKESDLVKICKSYMSIVGDGRSNIVMADSLKKPEEWEVITRVVLCNKNNDEIKKFNVILTNPPFGSKIKVRHEYILKNYELGYVWKNISGEWIKTDKVKETEPQILFIELCLNLLEDGGRMAIVLPDGLFGNPTDGYIREWIKKRAEIIAIIDCPHTTFMPHTHTKTSVLILKKWENIRKSNYPILMSVIEKCGHDNRGNEIYKKNKEGVDIKDEEFSKIVEIYKNNPERIINGYNRLGFTIYENSLINGILIPRYYNPDTKKEIEKLRRTNKYILKSMQELIKEEIIYLRGAGTTVSSEEYNIFDNISFLRTSDIGCWETRNYAVQNVSEETYIRYKATQDLKEGDILFVKDGTYRIGETIILTKFDLKMLVQSHYLIVRSLDKKKLDPYLLLYLLNTSIVRKQIDERTFVQATLSTIGNRLNEIILPIPKQNSRKSILAQKMKDKIYKRAVLRKEIKKLFD
jgi:type I restriction enzyme M protein